jgi:LPS export ABC transporter protein LptC
MRKNQDNLMGNELMGTRVSGKENLRPLLIKVSSLILLLLCLSACQEQKSTQEAADSTPPPTEQESGLTLNNATLEQSNAKGQTLWRIQVDKAVYSPDKKKAEVTKVRGNLFQDGKIVLQVSANRGEINRDGEEIFLKENIIATDPRNGAVLRSEEVEWRPKNDVLIARKKLRGNRTNLEATATEGKYFTRRQRLELIGNIIATAKDPKMQLKTQHLFWDVGQDKIIGDRPLTMVRYQNNAISDRVSANRAEVNLKTTTVAVRDNVEYRAVDPQVQIAGDVVTWNYKTRLVLSNRPIKIFHYKESVTITGNQGQVDLVKEIARLKGGVQGYSSRNRAKLYSREMVWYIPNQRVEALGNVIYEQAEEPQFNLTGDKAVGILQNNNIVVSGNNQERVVTEIYPE